ncbi:MAG: cell envelope integrity protein TolA [Pseudomonadales bacterium]|nr:cell envelope integrity protein TolA [Pseudomonadales bacterium]
MMSRYLHSPLVQSFLLHSALLAALWLFSAHLVPDLPASSTPLQATLVSSIPQPTKASEAIETPPPTVSEEVAAIEPVVTPTQDVVAIKDKAEKEAQAKADKLAKQKAEKEAQAKADKLAKEKAEKEAQAKADKLAKEKAEKEQKAKEEAARKKLLEALNKNNIDKEMAALESKIKAEKEAKLRQEAALAAQKEADRLAQAKAQAEQQAAAEKEAKAQDDLIKKYTKRMYEAIKREWSIPPQSAELTAQVRIVLLPDGEVRSILFLKRSGNSAFDASIEAAIEKASPLPVPTDAELFRQFRSVNLTFSSKD